MADEALLSIDQIEQVEDTVFVTIPVPEWKGSVRIGSLSGEQILEWVEKNGEAVAGKTAGIRLLALSLVDADGKRIGTVDTATKLGAKNAGVLTRLVNQARDLNGLREPTAAAKNGSGEASSVASPTA